MSSNADVPVAVAAAASEPRSADAGEAPGNPVLASVEKLREKAKQSFQKAQLLRKTTAGKQYLNDAKMDYIEALRKLSSEAVSEPVLALVCTLHANLSAVYLLEAPPAWHEAKAAAEIALSINPKHPKALYRRAQATLEDNREGLLESQLRAALKDLQSVCELEPSNKSVTTEAERVQRRLAVIEAARRVPTPAETLKRVPAALLDRGGDLVDSHAYAWGQSDTAVHIFVPARGLRIAKSKDITCEIKASSLHVALPCASDAQLPPNVRKIDALDGQQLDQPRFEMSGPLLKAVRPDESSWQLEDGGLLLHIELAKREDIEEHWLCAWKNHPETLAPSAKERRDVQEMAKAACIAGSKEEQKPKPAHADETVRRLQEMCPGVNIEWGDTSIDGFR